MDELWIHGISGGLSSLVSSSLLHPFEVVRTRLQSSKDSSGLWEYILKLQREKKLSSLYSGFVSTQLTALMSYSSYFLVYRLVQKALERSRSSLKLLDHVLVSCAASFACVVINTPIWTVNTRLMKEENGNSSISDCFWKILNEEGILGLYKGVMSSLVLIANPMIQYTLYEKAKQVLGTDLMAITYFLIGAATKFIATIFTFPVLTVRTRIQLDTQFMGFWKCAQDIFRTEKFTGFYKGFSTKIVQTLLNSAIILAIHEKLTKILIAMLKKNRVHTLAK